MSTSSSTTTNVESSPDMTRVTLTAAGSVLCIHTSAVSSSMELAFGADPTEAPSADTPLPTQSPRGCGSLSTMSHTPLLDSPISKLDVLAADVRTRALETLKRIGAVAMSEIFDRDNVLGSKLSGETEARVAGYSNTDAPVHDSEMSCNPPMHSKRQLNTAEGRRKRDNDFTRAPRRYTNYGCCSHASLVDTRDSVSARANSHVGERTLRDHAFLYWPDAPRDPREDSGVIRRKVSGAWRVVTWKLGVRKAIFVRSRS